MRRFSSDSTPLASYAAPLVGISLFLATALPSRRRAAFPVSQVSQLVLSQGLLDVPLEPVFSSLICRSEFVSPRRAPGTVFLRTLQGTEPSE